jgi:peptide/nickel transport system substrate-binding protein
MYDKEHPLINKVKEQFADGRMGRRDFLRYSTLLGMSAMAAYAFVGKVTGIDYVPQAGAASMPVGGTMRVAQRVAEVSDAHALSWFFWSNKVFPVCQTLSRTGADNITRPLLAKGFSANEDLTSWTIHLRPEAKWTSGRPFIADDVIANLEHLLDPDTGSSAVGLMAYLMKDVEKDGETTKELWDANALEKVDDHTFNFNLASPQVAIPEHLYNYPSSMTHPEDGFLFGPGKRGTGPYQCLELVNREKNCDGSQAALLGTRRLSRSGRVRRYRCGPGRGVRRARFETDRRPLRD